MRKELLKDVAGIAYLEVGDSDRVCVDVPHLKLALLESTRGKHDLVLLYWLLLRRYVLNHLLLLLAHSLRLLLHDRLILHHRLHNDLLLLLSLILTA